MDRIINLNVGAKLYTTSISTLTRYPDSLLGKMFQGDIPSSKDAQGNVVIDRNGKLFRFVLSFLRSSKLTLPENFDELALLKEEAEFYQISELIAAVEAYPLMKDVFMLNVGGTVFPVLRKYLQPDNCEKFGEVLDLNKEFDIKKGVSHMFYKKLLMRNSPYKDHRLILGNLWETICSPNAVKDRHGNYIIDGYVDPQLFGDIYHFVCTKRFAIRRPSVITAYNIDHGAGLQYEFQRIGINIHVRQYLSDQEYLEMMDRVNEFPAGQNKASEQN